jgi:aryl-alcohol dehydrogenase-like predicted oxidoreductase
LKLTNIVDTAVQYSSPDLIGSVLSEFRQNNKLNRSSVVVVGRGGVFDPLSTNSNLKVALDGFLSSSSTSFDKIGNKIFSISPQAIELSIDDLTSRLQLKTIDFFLLQGPELLLGPAASLVCTLILFSFPLSFFSDTFSFLL